MACHLERKLMKRMRLGNLRELTLHDNLIDFSSNDYLGIARSSDLSSFVNKELIEQNHLLNKFGSTGSRLLTGNSFYVQELEKNIAAFHGYPSGLLFNCGYMANVGLYPAIMDEKDILLFDSEVHASTRDGIRLSKVKAFPFKHNDLEHLEKRLKSTPKARNRYICIESIYSTNGSIAPLSEICQLAAFHGTHLIVDEAHAVGVLGPQGKGLIAENHLTSKIFAQIITFGKALGTQGAIILGSPTLKKALINFSTSYIYTTALPLFLLAAIKGSYELFPKLECERNHLRNLIKIFQRSSLNSSSTPIQSISCKGNEAVKSLSTSLARQGFDVRPLTSPTVKQGEEKLRICLHAFNSENELNTLLTHFQSSRRDHE